MAVGDCENSFLEAARRDGVKLKRYKKPWLNQQGHFGLPDEAGRVRIPLRSIFLELGGDASAQASKRQTPLPGDFIHLETGTIIEVDEIQHFTSFRMKTFDFYGSDDVLGFDVAEYRTLCRRYSAVADAYRRTKAAVAFGAGGRQRQRAYYDSLRDLTVPAMGHPPLIRVPAIDSDGAAAFVRNRQRILAAVQLPN